jgi:ATP-binding cassette, subfamily F, member 3
MLGMISAQKLSFKYGTSDVFNEVSFSVSKNTKVGLIGPNGAGKTTLFNLITKKEVPSSGKIEITGRVGYVPQEVKSDSDLEGSDTVRIYLDPTDDKQDFEIKRILDGLELNKLEFDESPKNLSGGQKTKLALAKALLSEPEILLLDEPTNFLDIDGKRWVMKFLSNYPKTLVLISHDIVLMDNYIDKVIAIDTHNKKIEEYNGNYTKYLKLKSEKDELTRRHVVNEQKHIKKM